MQTSTSVSSNENQWQQFYLPGAVAALILLAYSLATIVMVVLTGGQPATVEETYHMLQENRLVGLLRLDLLTVLVMPLYYVLFISVWASLKQVRFFHATLSLVLVFAGVTLFLAAPSVFTYSNLSDQFAAAANEAQRSQILAAGEAIVASDIWHGTGSMVGGMLTQTGATLLSIVMLRGGIFSKATAWVGIVTHGLDLVHMLVGFFDPALAVTLMAVAGPLYLAWFPLIAVNLYQAARNQTGLVEAPQAA